jgi:PAS domain S-box-containing protein
VELQEFNRILKQVLILPVIALLLLAAVLYEQIEESSRTVSLIQQSDDRIAEATLAAALIVDEETALRGYQITANPSFLQPYNDAQPHLEAQFRALENVPGADQIQKSSIQDLRESQQTWHDAFAEPIIASISAGGQTNDLDLNLHGKQLMEKIRSDLDTVIRNAQQNRRARINLWRSQVREIVIGLFVFAILFGILIGLFVRSRMRNVSAAYRNSLDILGRRADELFESEEQLRTTLTSIGDGVITCDVECRVELMNPVAQELTGWSQHAAAGLPLEQVFHIFHETTREVVENPISKAKRLNRSVALDNHTVLVRRDASEIAIADSGAPIRDKKGGIAGFVLVFRDVTLERRTQEALLANEKLAVAGRLAATIAHEIHNPLDSVSNLLFLMRSGASPEEFNQFMSMAEQELARVTQISRAMLGLYRESKTPVQVDLQEMLQEILLLLEHRMHEMGVNVHYDLPAAIHVEGFPAELRQVFTNLITNAGEAAGTGGEITISVASRLGHAAGSGNRMVPGAIIRIADNGPGIPEDIQPNLFQPFFTTKGEQGTGLGLWVSRGIVTKHGGTIEITSSTSPEAHGTVVSVFLAAKPAMQLGGN